MSDLYHSPLATPKTLLQSYPQLCTRAPAAAFHPHCLTTRSSIYSGPHRSAPVASLPLLIALSEPSTPQPTLSRKASRLTTNIYISLHSSKFNLPVSFPALLQNIFNSFSFQKPSPRGHFLSIFHKFF